VAAGSGRLVAVAVGVVFVLVVVVWFALELPADAGAELVEAVDASLGEGLGVVVAFVGLRLWGWQPRRPFHWAVGPSSASGVTWSTSQSSAAMSQPEGCWQ
jgi:hypothetical protein